MLTGVSVYAQKQNGNTVDPDEMACYEPYHLDLHCLYWYLFWFAVLKGSTEKMVFFCLYICKTGM